MDALKGEMASIERPIEWVGSSKKELLCLPEEVLSDAGYSLYEAQLGLKPDNAKPLKGFGDSSVQEVTIDYNTNTYRVVYTVCFTEKIYVLHVFQKKSKSGTTTPKSDIDLIKKRLKQVKEMEHYRKELKK